MKNFIAILLIGVCCWSCDKNNDEPTPEIPEFVFAGGETTIFDATSNAYAMPAPNLSPSNFNKHLEGDLSFEQVFVTAPAQNNPGLGPQFNNNSCVSCHIRNGRSRPSHDGNELSGFLIRLSVSGEDAFGGPMAAPHYGGQLQNRAIFGQAREANYTTTEIEKVITFADGSSRTLKRPVYQLTEGYKPFPTDLMLSPRVAPAVFGLGLLEEIPESSLLNIADENDMDADGISGKPNMVWNVQEQALTMGRFGWKAENPTARQQSAGAYNEDMGITSSLFPDENCFNQDNCSEDDGILDITDETLDLTTFYFQTLAVPAVRNYNELNVLNGRSLFDQLKCSSCHVPRHVTGISNIPELSNQTIYPYTDLLLHDMGPDLTDNRPVFKAAGNEWRTPPLWGIGLLPVVNGHSRLLHDGRARNIEEAILWHGGEAEDSRDLYLQLSLLERNDLLDFLNSL